MTIITASFRIQRRFLYIISALLIALISISFAACQSVQSENATNIRTIDFVEKDRIVNHIVSVIDYNNSLLGINEKFTMNSVESKIRQVVHDGRQKYVGHIEMPCNQHGGKILFHFSIDKDTYQIYSFRQKKDKDCQITTKIIRDKPVDMDIARAIARHVFGRFGLNVDESILYKERKEVKTYQFFWRRFNSNGVHYRRFSEFYIDISFDGSVIRFSTQVPLPERNDEPAIDKETAIAIAEQARRKLPPPELRHGHQDFCFRIEDVELVIMDPYKDGQLSTCEKNYKKRKKAEDPLESRFVYMLKFEMCYPKTGFVREYRPSWEGYGYYMGVDGMTGEVYCFRENLAKVCNQPEDEK